ncbi:MAG: hypothetical protein ACXAC2_20870 [Candidatus Kariarchaeaceae archaeon]|jgi:hypothetical protein
MNENNSTQIKFDQAVKLFIQIMENKLRENESIISIPLSSEQLKIEFINLVNTINRFPRSKSYNLNEINYALDENTFTLIRSSELALFTSFESLDKFNLLPGIFIRILGILNLVSDLNAKLISSEKVDNMACGGINSVEKPSILLNHIYKFNICPFCKDPVKVENIVISISQESLKGGITYSTLLKGSKISFHYKN